MRRILLTSLAALAAIFLASTGAGNAATTGPTILVKFKPGPGNDKLVGQMGDAILSKSRTGVTLVAVLNGRSETEDAAIYAAQTDQVVYAEVNSTVRAATLHEPDDPSYHDQWGLAKANALGGWDLFPGSYPVSGGAVIGIVDAGVDASHPDFAGRVLTSSGANCLTGTCVADPAQDDSWGHGTHVAGIAAASTNNGLGVSGLSFDSPILPVKVLNSSGVGPVSGVANGLIWAADHGARVINLSISTTGYSQTLCDAVTYANAAGALVVAAAGNDGTFTNEYPAACPGAVGVAATDQNDAAAPFSDYGFPDVFVSAPGVSILSTLVNGTYGLESGTSMAAPFVTGLAALLFTQDPSRSVADVKRLIALTSAKVGSGYGSDRFNACGGSCTWSSSFGYGRVDVARALSGTPAPDFSVSASPSSVSVDRGATANFAVSTSAVGGFSGTATLSVSGAPSGVTATLGSTSLSVGSSTSLSVTTTTTMAGGTYPLTITATSNGATRTGTATLVVNGPDFAVSLSPASLTRTQGKAGAYTVATQSLLGFSGTATLSVSGLPPGTTAAFSRSSVTVGASTTLTVTPATTTPVGTYTINVTATNSGRSHTASASLVVVEPDFALALTPDTKSITQGKSGTYTVAANSLFGSTGTATLSLSGVPTGMTAALAATSVSIGYTKVLTVTPSATLPAGTYSFDVVATAFGKTHSATVTVQVVEPDFSVGLAPTSLTVGQGKSGVYTVSAPGLAGSTGTATLSVSGAPAGTTATLRSASLALGSTTTLTIAATTAAVPGTYQITLTGSAFGKTHTATADLVIVVPDFSFNVSPASPSVVHGSFVSLTVSAASVGQFSGTITVSAVGVPTGVTASFSRTSISTTGSVTLKLTAASTMAPGTYSLSVKGVSGTITHTVPVTLTVT
jgi:subtilisin family serine protease